MNDLVRYDSMIHAIAECHRVDEVKDIRDKASALEAYARQAKNVDAERKAREIRFRAERKAGDLLHDMRQKGARAGRGKPTAEHKPSTLKGLGISETQSARWQQLANVPEEEFEAALRDPETKPTTNSILAGMKAVNGATKMDNDSLWICGRLTDFERMKLAERPFADILGGMTENMQADVRRIIPKFTEWLMQIEEVTQ